MPVALSAPFADTRAADLTWTLDAPELPALLARTRVLAGYRVELRVLGASHQVVLADGGERLLTETVACLPDLRGDLPRRARHAPAGLDSYEFTSRVSTLGPLAFAERVERVRAAVDGDPRGVVAAFPGAPQAITALLPEAAPRAGVRWRTWHAYPQTQELVVTATACERPTCAAGTADTPIPERTRERRAR
ncbi:DUF2617 family protein [Streptomonospora wellingtoniae]|uniref:DUF2617 family protein n=1 Tax=Streptomonospora wellingtoniae TaxID=3075544 RepID=A0ABU2KSS5_9ACTN|nr:DUF2617 family protein [Streptomonospora sp. DSM 45055]MDT0302346.1 DUF2617 family protein [Streptomonospora sp. DSM 45055]